MPRPCRSSGGRSNGHVDLTPDEWACRVGLRTRGATAHVRATAHVGRYSDRTMTDRDARRVEDLVRRRGSHHAGGHDVRAPCMHHVPWGGLLILSMS